MSQSINEVLKSLCPTRRKKIMDLVEAAGIDVAHWSVKKGGKPVKNPKANPQYCYEWAFGGGDEPGALCVWFRTLKVENGRIVYQGSLRRQATRLEDFATDRDNPTRDRLRAHDQARRAQRFDDLVKEAHLQSRPLRLVLLEGRRRAESDLGRDSSKVEFRSLDSAPWYVHSYADTDGTVSMARGIPRSDCVPSWQSRAPNSGRF